MVGIVAVAGLAYVVGLRALGGAPTLHPTPPSGGPPAGSAPLEAPACTRLVRGGLRRLLAPLLVVGSLVAIVAGITGGLAAPAAAGTARPVERVFVFSLPFVSWADLDTYEAPNLERFLDRAAIAGLTTRADKRETRLADGYLTLARRHARRR